MHLPMRVVPALAALAAAAILLAAACAPLEKAARSFPSGGGQVYLFLEILDAGGAEIRCALSDVSLVDENGGRHPLGVKAELSSTETRGWRRLAVSGLRPGRYVGMVWGVEWATAVRDGESVALEPRGPGGETMVDIDFTMIPGSSRTLFAQWSAGASLRDEDGFAPVLEVREQHIDLAASLAFVTNTEDASLTVVDRSLGRVVGSIAVGNAPMGIVASPDNARLYVANSGDRSISVVDVAAERVVDTIGNLGRVPTELALSRDGTLLFAVNTDTDSVSIIDTVTGQLVRMADVGRAPEGIVFDADRNKAYVANTGAGTVSVIDGNTLLAERTFAVGQAPRGLAVADGALFVTDAGTSALWAVDLPSYSSAMAVPAGSRGGRLMQGLAGMVYVADPLSGELAFVRSATRASVRRVPLGTAPGHMGLDVLHRKLYVVCTEADELVLVDVTLRKADAVVQVGRRPYGVVVINE
jgi:YVTN family beta-propeller protein